MPRSSGFTLIEVIISMTILALVVTVLYYAFSLGVSTWNRQEVQSSRMERFFKVLKFLEADFREMRPYTLQHEKGKFFFCHGSPNVFFYLTTHGFGALERRENAVYFSCLFVQEGDAETQSLSLLKIPRPGLEFMENFIRFQQLSLQAKDSFRPDQALRDESLMLLEDVSIEGFQYSAERLEAFQGSQTGNSTLGSSSGLAESFQEQWAVEELPAQVTFRFRSAEREYSLQAAVPRVYTPEEETQ